MEEKTNYESSPDGKIIFKCFFTKLLLYLIILVFIWFIVGSRIFPGINYAQILPIFIGLTFIILIYLIFLSKTYNYKITDRGIYFNGGILLKEQKFVPFFKITNVVTSQNIIEQLLGISQIGFQTAGTGSNYIPEIIFEGIKEIERPKKIALQLMEKNKK